MAGDCYICQRNEEIGALPIREEIVHDRGWRIAHAFDTSLPGWLIVTPTRHAAALPELDDTEAGAMGELLVRASKALRDVVGCEKTYSMLFAEAAGFGHLHVHVVPRMAHFTAAQVGPRVFAFLGRPPEERVPETEQDRLARQLREVMTLPLRSADGVDRTGAW